MFNCEGTSKLHRRRLAASAIQTGLVEEEFQGALKGKYKTAGFLTNATASSKAIAATLVADGLATPAQVRHKQYLCYFLQIADCNEFCLTCRSLDLGMIRERTSRKVRTYVTSAWVPLPSAMSAHVLRVIHKQGRGHMA